MNIPNLKKFVLFLLLAAVQPGIVNDATKTDLGKV